MMSQPDRQFDWYRLFQADRTAPVVADSRPRMGMLLIVFALLVTTVFARCAYLQIALGPAFRNLAIGMRTERREVAAPRGRIVARQGAVLAEDRPMQVLKVHYRTLESPLNQAWVRRTAKERLSTEADVRDQVEALHQRLARQCGFSASQWRSRCRAVQRRVERTAASVNRRHLAAAGFGEPADPSEKPDASSWTGWVLDALAALFAPPPPVRPAPMTIREELEYHEIVDEIAPDVAADIAAHPELYSGVTLDLATRRAYPYRSRAAHVLGHLGLGDEEQWIGRTGIERALEDQLRGSSGIVVDHLDASGRRVKSIAQRAPQGGREVLLTLDLRLQENAERLLDDAMRHRDLRHRRQREQDQRELPAGGSAIVMNVRTGALLVAASTPRFDPNAFSGRHNVAIRRFLSHPDKAMLDRSLTMAIPPGSVFKVLTAIALLEATDIDPDEQLACRGYLQRPDRLRCAIYRQYGIGHGPVMLVDALAQSCNVYFFHHAEQIGPQAMVGWATRFGLGQRTGIAIPGEVTGHVPTPRERTEQGTEPWRLADTQAMAIGQGQLTTTPIQIARMMAAIANGGWLVQPHVVDHATDASKETRARGSASPAVRIPGLHTESLDTVRRGLRRVVADPSGTAHTTVYLDEVPVAGKTGTAQAGADREDHAWFAGYLPAQNPQFAVVVALEHCGSGSATAGPIVRQLALQIKLLGLLDSPVDSSTSRQ